MAKKRAPQRALTISGRFMLAAVTLLSLVAVYQSYRRVEDFLGLRLAASLAVGENNITRTLDSVAFALGAVAATVDGIEADRQEPTRRLIADILKSEPAIRQIVVMDRTGRILIDSAGPGDAASAPDLGALGLEPPAADPDGRLTVGMSAAGRYLTIPDNGASGQWTIPVSLDVSSPGGERLRLVAALNPIFFNSLLDVVRTEERARIVMTRFDGAVLAAMPAADARSVVLPAGVLDRLPEADHGRIAGYCPFDRCAGILFFKSSPRYPVGVIAGLERRDILADWLADDWQTLIAMLVLPFLVGAVTWAQRRLLAERLSLAEMRRLAQHDLLTGLPNRALLDDRLMGAVHRAERQNSLVAVIFIDLNDFKPINDTYGHRIGDQTLIEVARRLQENLRLTDTVARIGGDEFVAILEQIHDEAEVLRLAAKVRSAVAEPMHHAGAVVQVGVSLGISLYPKDGADPPVLLDKADKAMYRAKAGEGICAFSEREKVWH